MALIKLDRSWNNKRAVTVDGRKAYEIKQLLIDMPPDLEEAKLDFLKAIECIYFSDGTRFPESTRPAQTAVNDTWIMETQGKDKASGS